MLTQRFSRLLVAALLLASSAAITGRADAQDRKALAVAKQVALIQTLQSAANKPEKAVACKQLAIYGTADAVPALAALLPDPELSSWARIALEAIPGPAPDDALRDAAGKVQGRLLIGVINSIGVRRDAKATDYLVEKLRGSDKDTAVAAAYALGRIGGDGAEAALVQSLASPTVEVRSAAAEGAILIAEAYMTAGTRDRAIKLYDTVRKSTLPRQRIHEATRGAILARNAAGVPLLIDQLRSQERGATDIGLRVARELQGDGVTEALVAELAQLPPDRQGQLLQALADRADAKAKVQLIALAALTRAAPNVRVVAAMVLERLGDRSCVSPLVDAAAGDDAELAQAAKTSLARLVGKDIDDAIFTQLQQSSGKMRQVLIELAEQRRIEGAMPVFMKSAEDPDPQVRSAALIAIGAIGDDKQMPQLVRLLQNARDEDRQTIERSVMSIAGRWGAPSVAHLVPLTRSDNTATQIAALRALSACGGADALAAVRSAVDDKDESVRDEAVRTLSTWPNRWRDDAAVAEPLLALAKSADKPAHRILALRGYLQFVQGARKLSPDQRLARVNMVLPLLTRPEEKRLAISVLGDIAAPGALEPLMGFVKDPAVSEEACSAILTLASRNDRNIPKERRKEALQTVVEKSQSEQIKTKAREALATIQ